LQQSKHKKIDLRLIPTILLVAFIEDRREIQILKERNYLEGTLIGVNSFHIFVFFIFLVLDDDRLRVQVHCLPDESFPFLFTNLWKSSISF
jgi:hypothetical protein